MRAVKSSGARPELLARRLCRELGMPGYRLNRRDIPGKPVIAFIGRTLAIFVRGSFWHRNGCKAVINILVANAEYWARKFARNVSRDKIALRCLKLSGWSVLTLWKCELSNEAKIRRRMENFFAKHANPSTR